MMHPPRSAIVTGGGKGLGAAIARRLATEGARVAVLGRDRAALDAVAREISGLAVTCDVTDAAALERGIAQVREALGPISISVHNAGIADTAPLGATNDA